jgi:hypothetical protein
VNTPTTITYTGSSQAGTTYSWNFSNATILSGTGAGPYSVMWTAEGSYNVSLIITSPYGCTSNTTNNGVQVVPLGPACCIMPTPNAGPDTSICGLTYALEGSFPAAGNICNWTQISGPGVATFANPYSSTTYVSVSAPGTYSFKLTEVNGACEWYDIVTIIFSQIPLPDAGLDFSVCGSFAHICATPSASGGQWSCLSGGIAYYDAPINDFIHWIPSYQDSACTWIRYSSENDTVTMIWFENNGVCTGYDTVNVYFGTIVPAISLVQPSDSVVCGPTFSQLNAQPVPAVYGYGYWTDNTMNTIFNPASTTPNPTTTIDTSGIAQYGYHNFYWITVNGNCRDTSELVRVNFKTSKISGVAQSSLVSDFTNFKAELLPEFSYENIPYSKMNLSATGNYSLWAEPNHNYYLKISAIDQQLYPTIANSYYNNTYNWQDATMLTTAGNCDTLTVNVPMVNMTPATGGNCRIYGWIRYDGSQEPVNNAMVYLRYQPNQDPARFDYSDQNGYYSVNNISTGNYKLFVDMPGLPQITNHHIVVNPNDTVFANVNFIVDTTSISKDYGFGIYADTTGFISVPVIVSDGLELSVFPNPFTDKINITGKAPINETITTEVLDNSGKKMLEINSQITKGDFSYSMPLSSLSKGIYFIKITIGNSIYIKKINKL